MMRNTEAEKRIFSKHCPRLSDADGLLLQNAGKLGTVAYASPELTFAIDSLPPPSEFAPGAVLCCENARLVLSPLTACFPFLD